MIAFEQPLLCELTTVSYWSLLNWFQGNELSEQCCPTHEGTWGHGEPLGGLKEPAPDVCAKRTTVMVTCLRKLSCRKILLHLQARDEKSRVNLLPAGLSVLKSILSHAPLSRGWDVVIVKGLEFHMKSPSSRERSKLICYTKEVLQEPEQPAREAVLCVCRSGASAS